MGKVTMDQGEVAATILIVEDDEPTRLLIRAALESDGYAFLEAKDGHEAVETFEREKPDLVLIDVAMPTMDGVEACKQIKALPDGIETPVLIVTGLDDNDSVERAFDAGATDYLTKPLHWAVTKNRVRRILATAQSERELRRLAYHDALTGLPNRLLFLDRAGIAIARAERSARLLAVLMIDVDGFKGINDNYGHDAGDRVLRVLADRIAGCLRKNDTVSRMGGDEFLILMEDIAALADVNVIATKILAGIREKVDMEDTSLTLTASMGIAFYPKDGTDITTLIRLADAAMYRAKRSGGNNIATTPPST